MLENNFSNSLDVLRKIEDNTVWFGSASSNFNLELEELINTISNLISDIDEFEIALNKLDKIKLLDGEINDLKNSLITFTDDMDASTKEDCISHNNQVNSTIGVKTTERSVLREEIIAILSSFGIIADIEVLQIPGIEGATVIQRYESGCLYEFITSGGIKYQAYVPFEVDPTASIVVYDPGGMSGDTTGKDWPTFKAYFESNGYDQICLRSDRKNTASFYMDLCDKLNLEPDSRLFISFSGGFRAQYEQYNKLIDEEGSSPGVLAMMDSYISSAPGQLDKIIEDETILLAFHADANNESFRNYYKVGRNENLNLLILCDKSEYGDSHAGMEKSLTQNGVLDFLTGKGELPNNYVIKYYNPSDPNAENGYSIVDYEKVKTLDDVYEFFGVEK